MAERRDDLADLLRTCVQCGLCLPHCATYLATGNEVQSPRGRLVLLEGLLGAEDPEQAAPAAFLSAFDQCIGCRACESVCPSGVPYSLLAHGHDLVDRGPTPAPEPAVPGPVLRRLDQTGFLRLVGAGASSARTVARAALGAQWRRRLDNSPARALARLVGSVPTAPATDTGLVSLLDGLVRQAGGAPVVAAPGDWTAPDAGPVDFFAGCANAGLLGATSDRLLAAVRLAGHAVSTPVGQDCCGALAAHTGRHGRAANLHRRNGTAFASPDVPVLIEAAGCGLELAETLGRARIVDAASLLERAPQPPRRPVPLKVALHDPCHGRHGLGLGAATRALLDRIPELVWTEPTEVEVCCGSGGAWGLRYPEMSASLGRRKAADLAATGADLVVTTNPGCLGQIADGLALEAPDLPILPLTDLWWYAVRR